MPERAASLGMRLTFGNPLPVEVRHLLDEIVILQQYGPVGPNGERKLIAGNWNASIGGCWFGNRCAGGGGQGGTFGHGLPRVLRLVARADEEAPCRYPTRNVRSDIEIALCTLRRFTQFCVKHPWR